MVEMDVQTFREVSLGLQALVSRIDDTNARLDTAMAGIESRLSLMTTVFAGAVVVSLACFGYLFVTTTDCTTFYWTHRKPSCGIVLLSEFDAISLELKP